MVGIAMRVGRLPSLLAVTALGLAAGCGGADERTTEPSVTTVAPDTDGTIRLTVLGDSIPFNAPEDCDGCTGFVPQFREHVAEATGRPVTVDNFSRHDGAGVADLAAQLESHAQLQLAIGSSDIVLVSVGAFDLPPFPAGGPCGGRGRGVPLVDAAADIANYTAACIEQSVAAHREGLATMYETIAGLRGDRPTLLLALNTYNVYPGNPGIAPLIGPVGDALQANAALAYDTWNGQQCEVAEAAGFQCVDLAGAFNGPDARSPAGPLLAPDHFHPSQEGNDAIAAILADIDLSPLGA